MAVDTITIPIRSSVDVTGVLELKPYIIIFVFVVTLVAYDVSLF